MTSPAKMKLYKTAYSPLYETFVGIRHTHQDVFGEWIITAHVAGTPQESTALFRVCELERFTL
jgi:hypothetical protein